MKTLFRSVLIRALALLLAAMPVLAEERPRYSQAELDQMLAPIALYPDPLLSQILMASTYPLEVVQAARWSRAHPQLKGQDAVRAAEDRDWEPSVKSLVAFPDILSMMDQKIDWTERLGNAFLAQQEQVMDTVQHLRRRAEAAGNLRSGERLRVLRDGEVIVIEPADTRVFYVPYYNPVVVYGPWWWPAYPPVYWAPWPGYYAGPGFVTGFYWGGGITISAGFFFGAFDWYHRHVRVVHVHHYHSHTHLSRHRTIVYDRPGTWRHDPGHRRGVPYRHAALREEYRHAAPRGDERRELRERAAAPAERLERRGQDRPFESRREAAPPPQRRMEAETEARTQPRFERRETEREAPRIRREARESPEARRERPALQDHGRREARPEPRGEGGRFQRNAEPRSPLSAAPPAARQMRPAEVQRPQPAAQRPAERGPQHGMQPPARRHFEAHPRAQGGEARGRGGEGPRRPFAPG